jgi:putative flippase GtrA
VFITVSMVFLFGALLAAFIKFKAVGCGGAFVAMMFGFFLASTGAAGPMRELTAAFITALSDLTS